MAWHINKRQLRVAAVKMREPQIDGDTSRLFLLETIGIRPRERLDERALPMVDMTRGADDHIPCHDVSLAAAPHASRREPR